MTLRQFLFLSLLTKKSFKLVLCYFGKNYSGFQIQSKGSTVAGTLLQVLQTIHKQPLKLIAAGRTDAGVHAEGQVVSYSVATKMSDIELNRAINSLLPQDIRIKSVEEVAPSFHALRDAVSREYQYLFSDVETSLSLQEFVVKCDHEVDLDRIPTLKESLLGRHNFRAFTSTGSSQLSFEREVMEFCVEKTVVADLVTQVELPVYRMRIVAGSFLYKMCRNIMGVLFDVLSGKKSETVFLEMLEKKQKVYQYKTAPAKGLCLMKVRYKE